MKFNLSKLFEDLTWAGLTIVKDELKFSTSPYVRQLHFFLIWIKRAEFLCCKNLNVPNCLCFKHFSWQHDTCIMCIFTAPIQSCPSLTTLTHSLRLRILALWEVQVLPIFCCVIITTFLCWSITLISWVVTNFID